MEILPQKSKDSGAVKYIAGHHRRVDLFLLVPYKSLLKYFAPKVKTPLGNVHEGCPIFLQVLVIPTNINLHTYLPMYYPSMY